MEHIEIKHEPVLAVDTNKQHELDLDFVKEQGGIPQDNEWEGD